MTQFKDLPEILQKALGKYLEVAPSLEEYDITEHKCECNACGGLAVTTRRKPALPEKWTWATTRCQECGYVVNRGRHKGVLMSKTTGNYDYNRVQKIREKRAGELCW